MEIHDVPGSPLLSYKNPVKHNPYSVEVLEPVSKRKVKKASWLNTTYGIPSAVALAITGASGRLHSTTHTVRAG